MARLISCNSKIDTNLTPLYLDIVTDLKLHYTHNPSFYVTPQLRILSFRGISKNNNANDSYIYIKNNTKTILNISKLYSSVLGVPRLIDPKVFTLGKDIYITYNSGYEKAGNSLFVQKISPKVETPQKIVYPQRNTQERNWAFFKEKGQIYALYSINPLKILKLKEHSSKEWIFEDYYVGRNRKRFFPRFYTMSIGSQLCKYRGAYFFMSHVKLFSNSQSMLYLPFLKKIYLGKLCKFDFASKSISCSKQLFAHSFKDIFKKRKPHVFANSNLYSCSYFSGLQIKGNYLYLGYGVNDENAFFSKVHMNCITFQILN